VLTSFLTTGGATLGPEKLLWLGLVVLVSADVPIVPTGALVSATAILAGHAPLRLILVVAFATAGAWVGDVLTLLLLEWGGGRLLGRLVERLRRSGSRTSRVEDRMRVHDLWILIVSRLIPGGRFPVLLAAAGGGLDHRKYIVHDLPACLIWSAAYAGIGIAGGAISGSPVTAILIALALVAAVTLLVRGVQELVRRRRPPTPTA
jgi:membrane protein DedA with SNARE-associated domain